MSKSDMKRWFFLIMAAIIIGVGCFAVMYWLVGNDTTTSLTVSIVAGVGGMVGELMRASFELKKRTKDTGSGKFQ